MKRLLLYTVLVLAAAFSAALADTPEQLRQQAEEALNAYRFDRAEAHFNAYQAALRKAKLPVDSTALSAARSIPRLRQALENVEDLVIFDSVALPAGAFSLAFGGRFSAPPSSSADTLCNDPITADDSQLSALSSQLSEAVQLPESAGRLLLPDECAFIQDPDQVDGLVFLSADGVTALWSAPGPRAHNIIYEGTRLTDGSWHIQPLSDIPAPAYAPFLLDDGMTLYYTTDAYPSLGGRDVMMSIRDDITEPWREPANLGMPVNSPADELLYVVDAVDSIGWFATLRSGRPVVYTFSVNDMRVNLPADADDLADRARISQIADTWPADFDRQAWLDRVDAARSFSPATEHDRNGELLPDGRTLGEVYEDADAALRAAIDEYESKTAEMQQAEAQLGALREAFGHGDRSEAMRRQIIDAETNVDLLRARLAARRNKLLKALGRK